MVLPERNVGKSRVVYEYAGRTTVQLIGARIESRRFACRVPGKRKYVAFIR